MQRSCVTTDHCYSLSLWIQRQVSGEISQRSKLQKQEEKEQTLLLLRRMGDRPKCDCGLVRLLSAAGRLPTSAQRRDGPASTSKQLHKRTLRTNQTLLTLLPSRHNLSLRLFLRLLSPICLLCADDVLPPSVKFLRGRRPGICISAGHQAVGV